MTADNLAVRGWILIILLPFGDEFVTTSLAAEIVRTIFCFQGIGLLFGHQLMAYRILNQHVGNGPIPARFIILLVINLPVPGFAEICFDQTVAEIEQDCQNQNSQWSHVYASLLFTAPGVNNVFTSL